VTKAVPGLEELLALVRPYLARQTWFSLATRGLERPAARVEILHEAVCAPGVLRLVLGLDAQRFQLLIGWGPSVEATAALRGADSAILGPIGPLERGQGPALAYEALADEACSCRLLQQVTGASTPPKRARHVSSLVSHASIVFDERIFCKFYRVLEPSPRPEVELTLALDRVGFNHLLAPLGLWSEDGYDLGFAREFLPGALEGRALARTSLRDLLAASGSISGEDLDAGAGAAAAAAAGGDLADEMRRLGEVTARLHLNLSQAFGTAGPQLDRWIAAISEACRRAGESSDLVEQLDGVARGTAGVTMRLHGDYHLRRVMRAEVGWIVSGFGDDPSEVASGRRVEGSPLEDLADLAYSLAEVAGEVARGRREDAGAAQALAGAWTERNCAALLDGYLRTEGTESLVPADPNDCALLLRGFTLVRRTLRR
jgi:maltokinase